MTAGPVNRALLESNFQNPGDVYDDTKTEGAFDVVADQVDDNWNYLSGLVFTGTLTPYPANMSRQALINSNFDVWRNGTSFTNPASGAYTADRFLTNISADGGVLPANVINSRQILTSGDIANSYYFYRIATDGAGSAFGANAVYEIQQRIENGTRFLCGASRQVTISFYARSSVAGKKIGIKLVQSYGTSGAPSASETINGANFSLTTSWARYTATLTTNTLSGKTFGTDNNDFLSIFFAGLWGSTRAPNYGDSVAEGFGGAVNIDIAQLQLSAGDLVVPYSPQTVETELEKSSRYTSVFTSSVVNFTVGTGFASSTTVAKIVIELDKEMRTTPTLVATATDWQVTDGVTSTDLTAIAISTTESNPKVITLNCTVAAGLTQFRPYKLNADGTANRLLKFDAEL